LIGTLGKDRSFIKNWIETISTNVKAKRTLPPIMTGRKPRRRSGMNQKKEGDAIDAAFRRLIGDDGFKPQGVFGTRKPTC
jgi:hypothetical protein